MVQIMTKAQYMHARSSRYSFHTHLLKKFESTGLAFN